MEKLKVLDLFSGIGGFSLGLEKTGGFETIAFCEIDEHCHKVLNKHWPSVEQFTNVSQLSYFNRFLQQSDDGEILRCLEDQTDIDVICGGFPCQDISVAGKQRGLIDEQGNNTRSGLWFEYARLIREIKPRYVIIENVAALRSNGLTQVLQDLRTLGYDAEWNIISARSIGACHLRERLWIIAYPSSQRLEGCSVTRESISTDREETLSEPRAAGSSQCFKTTNTNNIRLWESFTTEKAKQEWWTKTTASQRDWWQAESSICRMDDAISTGLHEGERFRKQRIKQLGNSIVPGIVEIIGRAILEREAKLCSI